MKTEEWLRYERERQSLQDGLGLFLVRFEPGADCEEERLEPCDGPVPLEHKTRGQ